MSGRIYGFITLSTVLIAAFFSVSAGTAEKQAVAAKRALAAGNPDSTVDLPENYTADQVQAIMAGLSDEQVRQLLIKELRKAAAAGARGSTETSGKGPIRQLERVVHQAHTRMLALSANLRLVPRDVGHAFGRITDGKGFSRLIRVLGGLLVIYLVGFGVEALYWRISIGMRKRIASAPSMEGLQKFGSAALNTFPEILGIFIFSIAGAGLFLMSHGPEKGPVRIFFVAGLLTIFISRFITALSRMLCSPKQPALRIVPLGDAAVEELHRVLVGLIWLITVLSLISVMFIRLEFPENSQITLDLVLGSFVLLVVGLIVWRHRSAVAGAILSGGEPGSPDKSWLREQFAAIWHILASFYLFVVWLVWAERLIVYNPDFDAAFYVSLLIVPIYLALDRMGQWLIHSTLGSMQFPAAQPAAEQQETPADGDPGDADTEYAAGKTADLRTRTVRVARRAIRVLIFFALVIWMMEIWGFDAPYGKAMMAAAFDVFITLALALVLWRVVSGFVDRKLRESLPEEEEDAAAEDDEWGGTATLDRNYTLLPMLKKAVGSVMMVMVVLIVLSAIGVDIGPLLAGAGVVGLAIGFGAQKLVSDVLSGFFFLVDDAFRVGEYIQAGSVSGAVEAISLRNVMLRHHRGMLQIVPFSDLGSITNFMRGGIVVKFNLELPYDVDIEKVRKVIKKVGQAMMEDPEYGEDIMRPVKSQGVRAVGDSVMTFRVKFTAKPGKHFLIRREAFRQITEALEAKGIHYAHRKVIVELPQYDNDMGAETGIDASGASDASGESDASGALGQIEAPETALPDTTVTPPRPRPDPETPSESPSRNVDKNRALLAGAGAALDTIVREKKEPQPAKPPDPTDF